MDALEETGWLEGTVGLQATNYAGIANFNLSAPKPFTATLTAEQINERNRASLETFDDLVVKPASDVEKLNTPFDKLAASYDVVVAGAGTSGWAAAIQAARMGVKVLAGRGNRLDRRADVGRGRHLHGRVGPGGKISRAGTRHLSRVQPKHGELLLHAEQRPLPRLLFLARAVGRRL